MSTEQIVGSTTEVATPDSTPVEPKVETEVSVEEQINDSEVSQEETEIQGAEPSGAQKRIKQLAAQRKAAEEARIKAEVEREYYKGLAEGRVKNETQSTPQTPTINNSVKEPVEPNLENFETFEEYERANKRYIADLAKYELRMEMQKAQQAQIQTQKNNEVISKFNTAAKEDPAFAELWTNKALWDTLPINNPMAEVIANSDIGPELIKWVHNNRTEANKIAAMPPVMAIKALTMVEAKMTLTPKPETKKVSAAPSPIQTINPATSAEVDEDNLPMEEYYKRRTKQLYGR